MTKQAIPFKKKRLALCITFSFGLMAGLILTARAENIAIGDNAQALAEGSISIGDSKTEGNNSVAIGLGARTTPNGKNSVALGSGSLADRDNVISVGRPLTKTRQIIYVKAGTAKTDAVNVGQLNEVSDSVALIRSLLTANSTPFITNEKGQLALNGLVIQGKSESTVVDGLTAVDRKLTQLQESAGIVAQDETDRTLYIGANFDGGIVNIGGTWGARALDQLSDGRVDINSLQAINGRQLFKRDRNIADIAASLGGSIDENGDLIAPIFPVYTNSTFDINSTNNAQRNVSSAIGHINSIFDTAFQNITDIKTDIILAHMGITLFDDDSQEITLGREFGGTKLDIRNEQFQTRALTGISSGQLSEVSTDAVNGSQLFTTNTTLSSVASNIGGSIDDNGNFIAPTFKIGNKESNSVGNAIADINSSMNEIANGKIGLVQQDPISKIITIGKSTLGTSISLNNQADEARMLDGVANGNVAEDSHQAINGSQLFTARVAIAGIQDALQLTQSDLATTRNSLKSAANALDGDIDTNGNFIAPQYDILGQQTNSVGGAFASIESALTALKNTTDGYSTIINDVQNAVIGGTTGLVQQDSNSKAITVAKSLDGGSVDVTGTDGERVVTGVGIGTLSANSTDAVNGSQLNATNESLTLTQNALKDTARALGGDIMSTGDFVAPLYDIQGVKVNTVGDAFNQVDLSLGGLKTLSDLQEVKIADLTTATSTAGQQIRDLTDSSADHRTRIVNLEKLSGDNRSSISDLRDALSSGYTGMVRQDPLTRVITVAALSDGNRVEFGGTNGVRTLSGIAEANLSANSNEAVIGSQLYNTNTYLKTVAQSLGGSTDDNGNFIAPQLVIQGSTATSVSDAFNNVDGVLTTLKDRNDTNASQISLLKTITDTQGNSITDLKTQTNNNTDRITNVEKVSDEHTKLISNLSNTINNGSSGLVRQDATTRAITVAADKDGRSVSLSGTEGDRVLSGVAAGRLTNNSNDAVNGSQLNSTNLALRAASKALGGDLTAEGQFIAPEFDVQGIKSTTVSDALAQVDQSLDNLKTATTQNRSDITTLKATTDTQGKDINDLKTVTAAHGDSIIQLKTSTLVNSNNITNLANQINNGMTGLVRQDPETKTITVAADRKGNSVSIEGANGKRTMSGVADGMISANSSEVVNGSQLFRSNSLINAISSILGANLDGKNGFKIADKKATTVVEALDDIDGSLGNLDNKARMNRTDIDQLIEDLAAQGPQLVRQDAATKTIKLAENTDGMNLSVKSNTGNRKISGIAAGEVSATSDEAINGSQLHTVNNRVDDLVNGKAGLITKDRQQDMLHIGRDDSASSVDVAGSSGNRIIKGLREGVDDSDAVTLSQLTKVSNALRGAEQVSIKHIAGEAKAHSEGQGSMAIGSAAKTKGTDTIAIGHRAVASESQSVAIGANSQAKAPRSVALGDGSIADRANSVSVGSVGNERTITNVAPGVLDTDAANVGQLKELQSSSNRAFSDLNKKLDNYRKKINGGIASSMAMAGIPQAYNADSSMIGGAISSYGNQSAIAFGMSRISENGKWTTKMNAGLNTQHDLSGSIGVGYSW